MRFEMVLAFGGGIAAIIATATPSHACDVRHGFMLWGGVPISNAGQFDRQCLADVGGGDGYSHLAGTANCTDPNSCSLAADDETIFPDGTIRDGSGNCLDVLGNDPSLGVVGFAACNGTGAQQWSVFGGNIAFAQGFVPTYCLAATGETPGNPMTLVSCSSVGFSGKFMPFAGNVGSETEASLTIFSSIADGSNSQCLDVFSGNIKAGEILDNYDCKFQSSGNQVFFFDMSNRLHPASINQNLCVTAASTGADGVTLQNCNNNANQQWFFAPVAQGAYNMSEMVTFNLNDCLDVLGGSHVPGTDVDLATCVNGEAEQIWNPTAILDL